MRHRHRIFAACAAAVLTAGVGSAQLFAQAPATARADLQDAQGRAVGSVTFTEMARGLLVRAELTGLPPGWHGFHVHAVGRCEPPFESAGPHFNPDGHKHGMADGGMHAGDLPNIHVGADGRAMVEHFATELALQDRRAGQDTAAARALGAVQTALGQGPSSLLDQDGSAILVHAQPDDYRTDPSGQSGARIACGVIRR